MAAIFLHFFGGTLLLPMAFSLVAMPSVSAKPTLVATVPIVNIEPFSVFKDSLSGYARRNSILFRQKKENQ
jgi:hypothetical protein